MFLLQDLKHNTRTQCTTDSDSDSAPSPNPLHQSEIRLWLILQERAPPAGAAVVLLPSGSTQKQRDATHCSGRKSPAAEHAGTWTSAPAASRALTFRASARWTSQRLGHRRRRPVVREPTNSRPRGSTHQHWPCPHCTGWKDPPGAQRGTNISVPPWCPEQEASRVTNTWRTSEIRRDEEHL